MKLQLPCRAGGASKPLNARRFRESASSTVLTVSESPFGAGKGKRFSRGTTSGRSRSACRPRRRLAARTRACGHVRPPPTVSLSAAVITAIAGKMRVSKESSTDDGHSHSVIFN